MKSFKKAFQTRNPKDYHSNFMDRHHIPILSYKQIKKYGYEEMYLFYKNVLVGHGCIEVLNKSKKYYHTDDVGLERKHRKKGHGIFLYIHLIETARKIGVSRICSSQNLNQFSSRMWREKLPKIYRVKPIYQSGPCKSCGTCGKRVKYFYIDLDNNEKPSPAFCSPNVCTTFIGARKKYK